MAEEVEEEPKKSNLLKIIIFVVGGILLNSCWSRDWLFFIWG